VPVPKAMAGRSTVLAYHAVVSSRGLDVDVTRLPVQVAGVLSIRARGLRELSSAPKAARLGLGNAWPRRSGPRRYLLIMSPSSSGADDPSSSGADPEHPGDALLGIPPELVDSPAGESLHMYPLEVTVRLAQTHADMRANSLAGLVTRKYQRLSALKVDPVTDRYL
jgi:hypothetical protein